MASVDTQTLSNEWVHPNSFQRARLEPRLRLRWVRFPTWGLFEEPPQTLALANRVCDVKKIDIGTMISKPMAILANQQISVRATVNRRVVGSGPT